MTTVVISQPMYFPWVGLLEQIRLAQVFVQYDDVQFEKGGVFNRIQIKTPHGIRWLTVPLRDRHVDQKINEVLIDNRQDWRSQHVAILKQAYASAPYFKDMLALVEGVFAIEAHLLSDLAINSTTALTRFFTIDKHCTFLRSSEMKILGKSSKRVLDICLACNATQYVTGHGASKYLDHTIFEEKQIQVNYMNYQKRAYPQLFGDFTPFVSGLDLVANCGQSGADMICSGTMPWQNYLTQQSQAP